MAVPLTSLSHGAGCGCKLSAADLRPIVAGLPVQTDPRVLVGMDLADDAGVVKLTDELALVQTVDFFTPIVDDPYAFGRIAATNALSDVYAMGGTPVSALNLVAYPLETLGPDVLREILRGGADAVAAAGASIVGGYSIDDPEPKYGLAVTGIVDPRAVLTNAGGVAGDTLVLTKPLGAGAVATAAKRGLADDGLIARATEVMCELNRDGAAAARAAGAHALTDVTGFGLIGHLLEICRGSEVGATIDFARIPLHPGVADLAREGIVTGASARNWAGCGESVSLARPDDAVERALLTDPQTSGGLLVACAPDAVDEVLRVFRAEGFAEAALIGSLAAGPPRIVVR